MFPEESEEEEDSIFNIIHSLPALTHSVAIATRTPVARYAQKSMFMPDYGGILEIPNSNLKNNALATGIPFKLESNFNRVKSDIEVQHHKPNSDCLVLLSPSQISSESTGRCVVIRAIWKTLFFDRIEEDNASKQVSYKFTSITHKLYQEPITGLKLVGRMLSVKFHRKVITYKLKETLLSDSESNSRSKFKTGSSLTVEEDYLIKDTSINQYNEKIFGVASQRFNSGLVKLYDVTGNSRCRTPFFTLDIESLEDESNTPPVEANPSPSVEDDSNTRSLRGRTIRTFVSVKPTLKGIQQLDNIPSHIANMLITTSNQIALIDPRNEKLGQVYVDKASIPSFYPIEFLRKTLFSRRNHYQIYSISNVHVRVFDTRYSNMPLSQVNHMLDSETFDQINSKLINYEDGSIETVCCSSSGSICFTTFDQACAGSLVNPKCLHLPYHDAMLKKYQSFIEGSGFETFGLEVKPNTEEVIHEAYGSNLFSVLQISREGDLYIRDYSRPDDDSDMNIRYESKAELIMQEAKSNLNQFDTRTFDCFMNPDDSSIRRDMREKNIGNNAGIEYIDILNTSALPDIEDSFQSTRALERYRIMSTKLD